LARYSACLAAALGSGLAYAAKALRKVPTLFCGVEDGGVLVGGVPLAWLVEAPGGKVFAARGAGW
jgi:hypothetical protein